MTSVIGQEKSLTLTGEAVHGKAAKRTTLNLAVICERVNSKTMSSFRVRVREVVVRS